MPSEIWTNLNILIPTNLKILNTLNQSEKKPASQVNSKTKSTVPNQPLTSSPFSLAQTGSPGQNLTVGDQTALQMTPGCALALLQWKGALPTLCSYRAWESSSHEEQASHMGGNFINSLVLHSPSKNQHFQILSKKNASWSKLWAGHGEYICNHNTPEAKAGGLPKFQASLNHSEPWLKKLRGMTGSMCESQRQSMKTWKHGNHGAKYASN